MTPRRSIAAAMLDLDGTLLDTLPDLAAASARMLEALNLPVRSEAEIGRFVGKGIANLVQRCLQASAGPECAQTLQDRALALFQGYYFEESGRRTAVYPGVLEGLKALRAQRLRLACVTNKAERFTLPLLQRTGLADYFELVVSGDTLQSKKPEPGQLLHICSQFRLEPEQVLMIGDSTNDALAARAAGCPVICVSYGYNEGGDVHDLDCDAIVDSLPQVADIVQGVTRS